MPRPPSRPTIPLHRHRPRPLQMLRLHIRPLAKILHEMADRAGEFFVFVGGEGEDGEEAEGEPGPV